MQRGRLRPSIIGRDPAEIVVLAALGVIDEDVKITSRGKRGTQGVDQLELGLRTASLTVFPVCCLPCLLLLVSEIFFVHF